MEVKKSFQVLSRVWGNREGYVFLPWIDGNATEETRKKSYHEGRAFDWPKDKEAVLKHMEDHQDDDLYFCPNVFLMKRRATNFAAEEKALWADLDEVNPDSIEDDLKPTIAWESSPGRYQAIWLLTEEAMLASEAGGLGQRLTYHLGADLGGWDSTQLLRPPGWKNHKPAYREKYDGPVQGKLLWKGGPRYEPSELDSALPVLAPVTSDSEEVLEQEIDSVDRYKVLNRIKLKLPTKVKRLINAREADGDRSDTLFFLELSLAEADCTAAEIIAIVRPTVWNKFAGRNDELKRLKIEASKAIERYRHSKKTKKEEEESDFFEIEDDEEIGPAQNLYTLVKNAPRPKWLIQDIWTEGGVGFIDGSPKTYKSFFSLDMAISIATGLPFLGQFAIRNPGPVLYIQEEDTLPTLKQRLGQIGGGKDSALHPDGELYIDDGTLYWGPPKVPDIDAWVMKQATISDGEWQERIDHQLSTKDYRMMILDPQMMLMGEIQENSYGEMTEHFFKPLKQLANKYNLAVALIHHTNKGDGKGSRRGLRMLGSQAGFAWQQDALHLDKANDFTREVQVFRESKSAGNYKFFVQINFDGGRRQGEGLWAPIVHEKANSEISGEPRQTKREQRLGDAVNASHKALQELGGGSHSIAVIAEASSIKESSVKTQLSKLKAQGLVVSDGKGNWELSE